jgi:8-oxo-dGTP diphosphatase
MKKENPVVKQIHDNYELSVMQRINSEPIKMKTVAAVIEYPDGRILMVKRKGEPFDGYWCLAGGKLEPNETSEEACIREVKEETGLDVEIITCLGTYIEPPNEYKGVMYEFVPTFYVVKPKDSNQEIIVQETEVRDIQLFSPWDSMYMLLAFKHNEMIMDYIRWRSNSPLYGGDKHD